MSQPARAQGHAFTARPIAVSDEAARDRCRASLLEAARSAGTARLAQALEAGDPVGEFLLAVATHAPFLAGAMQRHADLLEALFDTPVDALLAAVIDDLAALARDAVPPETGETELSRQLRIHKNRAHLLIALGDLSGAHDVDTTTRWLSELATAALEAAIAWLLRDLHARGKLTLTDPADPAPGSGVIVLGMGKLGAGELNYSSDIDLIVLFDHHPDRLQWAEPHEAGDILSKAVRRLIRIMGERTGDGYVFRTDLRLRPDPGAMPLAISVDAAMTYYEARGQNWERAALIKARPVAGDIEAGERLLAELTPFVWRKYLDYASIADVQSIKRQIHAHKGHGRIAIEGHNVKLGRGGIREIEFFVQTQQLIAGGRAPHLRDRRTLAMLARFAEDGWIADSVRDEMAAAYRFLRRVEHVVQMIGDEQTHTLPESAEGMAAVAHLMGYVDADAFRLDLRAHMVAVEGHFGALFQDGETLAATAGNLSFTGDDPDPDTLSTLSQLGFERPADMWGVIRSWHFGRYGAVQSQKARERLTELTPALLESFAATGQPDAALLRFDAFLKGLPAGIQLFAMLHSNTHLLSLVMTILSAAPRLADIVTKRPLVFDGMLDPAFYEGLPDHDELKASLTGLLGDARLYEDRLDRLRIFAAEQRFLVGVRFLTGAASAEQMGQALTSIADLVISETLDAARAQVARRHGDVPGGQCCLMALGRLGSGEMTAGSDVDLILLYDHPEGVEESDGDKPIAPSQYYARVTQRLIAALSAPTTEGVLYEVDFRLRPSGNKGPLATSLRAFSHYQRDNAWTWEHMALTRARIFAGDADLCTRAGAELAAILDLPRDAGTVRADVLSMRQRLLRDKPARGDWDLKRVSGGTVDIDFLAQFWRLTALPKLNLNGAGARHILDLLDDAVVERGAKKDLLDAAQDYTTVGHTLRLCTSEAFDPDKAPRGLVDLLCVKLDVPSIGHVEQRLKGHRERVAEIFRAVIGDPSPDA
ncbi:MULTISPECIES: bifunctional [glutamine synthetase] adenylyltransferase/[glutamine synthetase]-adenylyl-L-tyrosine phosphorylase [unclassified Roseitalea]|uniref:bifunctional [glutamine synthetase] adenylyltransferase/[glutamine synthetase]-adenylyl-L-tyrosine phosphorylase n=1 Tax=unclassified Roseitalea TaxID=2639107 RepID=UPI00273E455A|nr:MULTISPECIES: bifunctional [glutamine synthetase] adenylyltransferase/[glutamine synthetase]-adenylyl-L-tyrosine phosphorylase [unclassified Roseitalea]